MILRRHIRQENWFAVILELVVVVVDYSSRSSWIVGMSRNGSSLICKRT